MNIVGSTWGSFVSNNAALIISKVSMNIMEGDSLIGSFLHNVPFVTKRNTAKISNLVPAQVLQQGPNLVPIFKASASLHFLTIRRSLHALARRLLKFICSEGIHNLCGMSIASTEVLIQAKDFNESKIN